MSDPTSEELSRLRAQIDDLDAKVIALLAERRRVVALLAREKRALGLGAVDATRERELRARWTEGAEQRGVPREAALAVLEAILTPSREQVNELLRRDGGQAKR